MKALFAAIRVTKPKSSFRMHSTIPFFEITAKVFAASNVRNISVVTGGGIASLAAHLQQTGEIQAKSPSSELATAGNAAAWTRTLKNGRGATGGTLGVGAAEQADTLAYLSSGHALPTVCIVGDNSDGKTGPASFQPVDVSERYRGIYGNNIVKIMPGDPENLRLQLFGLLANLEKSYVAGEPLLVSVPQNMAQKPVSIYPRDEIGLKVPAGYSRPKILSEQAKFQLDQLANAVNEKNARVLFVSGEGLGHAIRLEGEEVHKFTGEVMNKMVGNRITTSDWADMLHGHNHELPPASHNFDTTLQHGIAESNVVIFIGCGPNATLTGLQNGLAHYTNKNTKCFMIDSSPSRLDKWRKEPDIAKGNFTYIQAPIKEALENLDERYWENTISRNLIAGRIADNVRKEVFEGPQEVLGAQKMRDIAIAITQVVEQAEAQGKKIGISVSSGDASSQAALRYRTKPIKPGAVYYPNEGTLGGTLSAAGAMADTGNFDCVVAFLGDGEAGYTPLEFGYLSQAKCPVISIVFNNQRWEAVDKAQRPGIDPQIIKHMKRYGETINASFDKMADIFPNANIKKFSVEGNDLKSISKALQNALEHNGPSIIDVNIRSIARQAVLGKSR
jgi:thiamine pyrophosphate-dependent acetolactate synthase large subunit-like protein